MFRMKNKYGNVYKNVPNVRKKEELEKLGYTVVSAKTAQNGSENEQGITLNNMKIEDLKKLAEQNGIEITATKKADIIAEINKALSTGSEDGVNDNDDDELE